MNNFITSFVRTMVPIIWSQLVLWLLLAVPALEPARELMLGQTDVIVNAVALAAAGAWYALVRWLEPRLPDWLTRILMGAATAPSYAGDATADIPDGDGKYRAEGE